MCRLQHSAQRCIGSRRVTAAATATVLLYRGAASGDVDDQASSYSTFCSRTCSDKRRPMRKVTAAAALDAKLARFYPDGMDATTGRKARTRRRWA
ncbi:hypothetical protein SPI_03468 [Niveomyces insectorum RCEF 264]|uniref:Uncharacterized protein n=1 Tax=Niveomyces insectorum RCEF 264 TaxID=1081102 RepID=A0A167W3U8_9HYPO|nr:hypothetical protein SPI_03468 [Niveomyces insectorum RCEF 264]